MYWWDLPTKGRRQWPAQLASPASPRSATSDALTIGQLAEEWDRDVALVRRLIAERKVEVNERGLITNAALHAFFRLHGTELD